MLVMAVLSRVVNLVRWTTLANGEMDDGIPPPTPEMIFGMPRGTIHAPTDFLSLVFGSLPTFRGAALYNKFQPACSGPPSRAVRCCGKL